ncbi:DUF3626 domain-containing protein [Streptomyces sp. SID5785]|uniref:DUF3626 domain-containing protein n=1 Tax=Streptomyces sp. SID5785 TaxID=2690309 RepID=UPI001360FD64|nr:DUF3626 domain-containing protein [Streptomyces sp. SID5785]MZD09743.1 DUF3626 domain-containing protein [Streptomyces sp. SID5785]
MTAPATRLTPAQDAALHRLRTTARAAHGAALDRLARQGVTPDAAEALIAALRGHARVTLNFHPDRLLADGRTTVAAGIAADGRYRGQYETGLSNGSRTAHPGGLRDGWEHTLFGGAYADAGAAERPKYGALDVMRHPDGAAPRFGSCHVRLRPEATARATFCFGDSHVGPADVGTADALHSVLAALLEDARASGQSLGVRGADPVAEIGALTGPRPARGPGRSLDFYVEAQVHGEVDLAVDAEALVLDPSFRGTEAGELLGGLGLPVEWHTGFVLGPEVSDEELAAFRGPGLVPLAARVRESFGAGGLIDAACVGRAAASAVTEPGAWSAYGSPEEVLQYVKQVWHCLVRFGRSGGDGGPAARS